MTYLFNRAYVHAALGALFFLCMAGMLWFFTSHIESLRGYATEAEGRAYAAERKFAQARSFVRLHAETTYTRAELLGLLVEEEAVASFIGDIEELARRARVSLDVRNVDLKSADAPFSTLLLTLQFGGSFVDTYRFLSLIETLPRAVSIDVASL